MWREFDGGGRQLPRVRALLLAAVLALVACGGSEEPAESETYRVRGEIRRLPAAGAARQEVLISHEPIPEFVDRDGEVVGMEAMTMSFPLAEPELLAGLEVGDVVEFEFEVSWEGSPPLVVTSLEKLPGEPP